MADSEPQQTPETPQGEQKPLAPAEYRRMVIDSGTVIGGVIAHEIQHGVPQMAEGDPTEARYWESLLTLAHMVVGQLVGRAVAAEQEQQQLLVATSGPLLGPDGQPISRQARRQIERRME